MTFATVSSDCNRLMSHVRKLKADTLHLDLSEVKHCDSAGLALLIEAKRLCTLKNKLCEIHNIPKIVHRLAEFCGVGPVIGLSVTEPEFPEQR